MAIHVNSPSIRVIPPQSTTRPTSRLAGRITELKQEWKQNHPVLNVAFKIANIVTLTLFSRVADRFYFKPKAEESLIRQAISTVTPSGPQSPKEKAADQLWQAIQENKFSGFQLHNCYDHIFTKDGVDKAINLYRESRENARYSRTAALNISGWPMLREELISGTSQPANTVDLAKIPQEERIKRAGALRHFLALSRDTNAEAVAHERYDHLLGPEFVSAEISRLKKIKSEECRALTPKKYKKHADRPKHYREPQIAQFNPPCSETATPTLPTRTTRSVLRATPATPATPAAAAKIPSLKELTNRYRQERDTENFFRKEASLRQGLINEDLTARTGFQTQSAATFLARTERDRTTLSTSEDASRTDISGEETLSWNSLSTTLTRLTKAEEIAENNLKLLSQLIQMRPQQDTDLSTSIKDAEKTFAGIFDPLFIQTVLLSDQSLLQEIDSLASTTSATKWESIRGIIAKHTETVAQDQVGLVLSLKNELNENRKPHEIYQRLDPLLMRLSQKDQAEFIRAAGDVELMQKSDATYTAIWRSLHNRADAALNPERQPAPSIRSAQSSVVSSSASSAASSSPTTDTSERSTPPLSDSPRSAESSTPPPSPEAASSSTSTRGVLATADLNDAQAIGAAQRLSNILNESNLESREALQNDPHWNAIFSADFLRAAIYSPECLKRALQGTTPDLHDRIEQGATHIQSWHTVYSSFDKWIHKPTNKLVLVDTLVDILNENSHLSDTRREAFAAVLGADFVLKAQQHPQLLQTAIIQTSSFEQIEADFDKLIQAKLTPQPRPPQPLMPLAGAGFALGFSR